MMNSTVWFILGQDFYKEGLGDQLSQMCVEFNFLYISIIIHTPKDVIFDRASPWLRLMGSCYGTLIDFKYRGVTH